MFEICLREFFLKMGFRSLITLLLTLTDTDGLMADLRSYVNLDCYSEHKDHIHWILSASEDVLQRRFGIQDDVDVQPSIPSSNVSVKIQENEVCKKCCFAIA